MASFQSIVESLLPALGASRVLILLRTTEGQVRFAAEAVAHGARQLRNDAGREELVDRVALSKIEREQRVIVQNDTGADPSSMSRLLGDGHDAHAQLVAPFSHAGQFAGVIVVHDTRSPRQWDAAALEAVDNARTSSRELLDTRGARSLAVTESDLRDAALQAMLDALREGLRVQRCTLRQDVNAAYAFPVTHESRAAGTWSLHGDFTIVQIGQPVIAKMLAERQQVVQNDSRKASDEPLFHVMLKHYGDLRSQIVTPLFRNDALAAVLSVHSLGELRTWSEEERDLAKSAARLLGRLVGASLT